MKLIILDDNDNEICNHYIESSTLCDEDFVNGLIDTIADAEKAEGYYDS